MASIRQEKINNLLKQDLAVIFQQESRNLFGGAFITVTQVRISPDLGLAKVYVSIMTGDKEKQLRVISQHTGAIRRILGQRVGKQLRRVPELMFYLDDSLDYYEEIDRLLKK